MMEREAGSRKRRASRTRAGKGTLRSCQGHRPPAASRVHSDAKVKLALTMPHRVLDFAIVTALTFSSAAVSAQSPVDSALLRYIDGIRAIDAHAHPMLPVAPGAKPDTDYDALPLGGIPAFDVPSRLRQIGRAHV